MVLDKAGLLDELKLETKEVKIGKGTVIVSEISAVDWDEVVSSPEFKGADGKISEKKIQPALVARAVLNPDGSRMFTDEEAALVAHSSKKPFKALLAAVMQLNGLSGDVVKNSEETAPGDSISGSVSTLDTDTLNSSSEVSQPGSLTNGWLTKK